MTDSVSADVEDGRAGPSVEDPSPAPPVMFQSERQRKIVALTRGRNRVEVADLAERFGVTTETVRRDLSDLQRQRLVRRVHGGAVLWETEGLEPLLSVRTVVLA